MSRAVVKLSQVGYRCTTLGSYTRYNDTSFCCTSLPVVLVHVCFSLLHSLDNSERGKEEEREGRGERGGREGGCGEGQRGGGGGGGGGGGKRLLHMPDVCVMQQTITSSLALLQQLSLFLDVLH